MPKKNFAVDGDQTVSSSRVTALGITSTTAITPQVNQLHIGCTGAAADNQVQIVVQRYTAAGTATSVTPLPLDPTGVVAVATAGSNHTVEPTYTSGAVLLDVPFNSRATYSWYATPGCEWVLPATAANGIGVGVLSPSFTGDVQTTLYFTE